MFFKGLASTLSVLGFSVAIALPTMAQSNFTPGPANDPSQPGAPPTNRDYGIPPRTNQGTPSNDSNTNTNPNAPASPSNSDQQPFSGQESVPGVVNPANRPVTPGSSNLSFGNNTGSQTIDEIVRTSPSFELFNALLRVANSEGILATELSGDNNVTVFAPTDEALAQLPPATFKALVQPENRDLLASVLQNHIVRGKVSSSDLAAKQVRSMGGNALAAQGGTGSLTIGNARVIGPDVQASNGIIHVVDNVILPANLQAQLSGLSQQPMMNQQAR